MNSINGAGYNFSNLNIPIIKENPKGDEYWKILSYKDGKINAENQTTGEIQDLNPKECIGLQQYITKKQAQLYKTLDTIVKLIIKNQDLERQNQKLQGQLSDKNSKLNITV